MTVTFQPNARQKAQLIWACQQAGVAYEPGEISGTMTCYFDDPVEMMAWHKAFIMDYGWAPLDMEMSVAETQEKAEEAIDVKKLQR